MIITLSIFYYLYLIAIAIFIIGSFFNFYHLLRFGFSSAVNIIVILIYIIVSSVFVLFSLEKLSELDWSQTLIDTTVGNYDSSLFYD